MYPNDDNYLDNMFKEIWNQESWERRYLLPMHWNFDSDNMENALFDMAKKLGININE